MLRRYLPLIVSVILAGTLLSPRCFGSGDVLENSRIIEPETTASVEYTSESPEVGYRNGASTFDQEHDDDDGLTSLIGDYIREAKKHSTDQTNSLVNKIDKLEIQCTNGRFMIPGNKDDEKDIRNRFERMGTEPEEVDCYDNSMEDTYVTEEAEYFVKTYLEYEFLCENIASEGMEAVRLLNQEYLPEVDSAIRTWQQNPVSDNGEFVSGQMNDAILDHYLVQEETEKFTCFAVDLYKVDLVSPIN